MYELWLLRFKVKVWHFKLWVGIATAKRKELKDEGWIRWKNHEGTCCNIKTYNYLTDNDKDKKVCHKKKN